MDLMSRFFGNGSDGARTGVAAAGGPTLMDRFMNPLTQSGISTLAGQGGAQGAAIGQQYMKNRQADQLASLASTPEEAMMIRMAPEQYVAGMLAQGTKPKFGDAGGQVHDLKTGKFVDQGQGQGFYTPQQFDKEFDASKYTGESWIRARNSGDPRMLVSGGPAMDKDRIQGFEIAQNNIEKRLNPIRTGMQAIQMGRQLLREEGGAADYSALVTYVKAADPGTAAMAAEVGAAAEAQGYMNVLNQIAVKAQGNGFLTADQKKQMYGAYAGMEKIYEKIYEHNKSHAGKLAKEFNLPEDLISGSEITFGDDSGPFEPRANPTFPDAAKKFGSDVIDAFGGQGEPGPKIPFPAQKAIRYKRNKDGRMEVEK